MTIEPAFKAEVTEYPIRYSVWDYTFPEGDTITNARFDADYIHIHLTDGRILSLPLDWIPPLRDATSADREKFYVSDDGTALVWDPEESPVNEILRLSDYLCTRTK